MGELEAARERFLVVAQGCPVFAEVSVDVSDVIIAESKP
jgi:hypothetical protein